jgi:hypothetical protein
LDFVNRSPKKLSKSKKSSRKSRKKKKKQPPATLKNTLGKKLSHHDDQYKINHTKLSQMAANLKNQSGHNGQF